MNDQELLLEADRCVKCGLCLSHCPTYCVTRNECESPRGRIALIQGLLESDLRPDDRLLHHLDSCLHCLNCQGVCPPGVKYASIIDSAMSRLPKRRNIFAWLLTNLSIFSWSRTALRFFRNLPLYRLGLLLAPPSLKNLLKLLPPLAKASPTESSANADIQLFLGCVSRITDQGAIDAFTKIADRLQIPLAIPSGQGCCGAIHGHGGNSDQAESFKQQNSEAFQRAKTVISLASGCGAYLKTYLEERVVDASDFLVKAQWPNLVTLRLYEGLIAIHTPCSLRNSMKSDQAVIQLIEKIPGARQASLSTGNGCCGAAGIHLVYQPEVGQSLLMPIVDEIIALRPSVVVTSNTGCALHIRRGLQDKNLDIPVMHPVELIASLLD